ncbi:Uu.00g132980.m01.CDS01 [Anthostomella pinea]|uniref:Uu.00g132980.m01.CDS01 n=1 Tax=Anthostomella pinea TaxID=933095 RepID=A0AAI8YMN4_9PEZI|nr:Uu.00g132980.m01.CDS01 [Anthostomella pinea]
MGILDKKKFNHFKATSHPNTFKPPPMRALNKEKVNHGKTTRDANSSEPGSSLQVEELNNKLKRLTMGLLDKEKVNHGTAGPPKVTKPQKKQVYHGTATNLKVVKPRPAPDDKAKAFLTVNKLLLEERIPKTALAYTVHDWDSGCVAIARKETPGSRPDLTVGHNGNCQCLDVRMTHLCDHADRMVKQKRIMKARRDDLVLALKLRNPDVPKDLRLVVKKQRPLRPLTEEEKEEGTKIAKKNAKLWVEEDEEMKLWVDEEEEKHRRRVAEYSRGQVLMEKWKTDEAWQQRNVWKDW